MLRESSGARYSLYKEILKVILNFSQFLSRLFFNLTRMRVANAQANISICKIVVSTENMYYCMISRLGEIKHHALNQ